jgi:hypothetical protein
MKKILALLIFFALGFTAQAQETAVPHRSLFLELGGSGLAYSFNYDFRFDSTRIDSWGMRVGAGGYGIEGDSFFSVPVLVNKLYGKGPHYFELGIGATLFGYTNERYTYCANGFYDANGMYVCNDVVVNNDYNFILPVDGNPSLMGTMNIGYRKVPVDGGFTWRVNLTPIFNNNGFWPLFAGVGFGYAF